ncbi:MAG: hypothetical protein JXR41_15865 [Bacteroidales bacterium]|nr:hypothetical protein [Bacteroidales bacterium]MBN2764572.1 hypothetical protein [Bacteroidales bacterium]
MKYRINKHIGDQILPVDIVLSPEWWHKHEGITFDQDFFYHPKKRVEVEQQMEKILFNRWGRYDMGQLKDQGKPEIGAVHLAAGFLLSEMMGCRVDYSDNHPPQVIPARREDLIIDNEEVFKSGAFKKLLNLWEALKTKYGYLTGDINWGGILNLALDLRGEEIFTDMMLNPTETKKYFGKIAAVISAFTQKISAETRSTSISVNRVVRHLPKPVFLHSECSHTMISVEDYEQFLMDFDLAWSNFRPFGIHYCGSDPHRMAESFAKIPHLDFLDVGWGGDVKILRHYLPDTFLNIRLSPVEIINQTNDEISKTITRLVNDSGNPFLTGVCCINMDDKVGEDKIETIFKTVETLKKTYIKEIQKNA